ncbi:MAG: hypothetical protein IKI75_12265 [Lachnospiraceae bacterium]|nr:hypothetical protein [Lachnospiraceae bacterium]
MATINNAALSNVYNYFQADLVPRSSSGRFDSHNKKDLKDIYRSIVKLSKDEPVFLMDRSREVEEYTIHMKESALRFRSEVASIGGLDEEMAFNQKTAFSSDPSVAEVRGSLNGSSGSEEPENITLELRQLATPQKNEGRFLPENERDIPPGNYSFDVATGSSKYELQFSIGDGDTNRDIQNRLARLINNFKLGLTAQVEQDGLGNSALIISSRSVGDRSDSGGHFNISDEETSQQAGIVDYLGIRRATEEGADAVYSINDEYFTSPGNEVRINDSYDVRFKEAAPGRPVTIGYKPDVESMKDNIISLAGSYNNFIRATAEYVDRQPRTNLLVRDMKINSAYYTRALSGMGVSQEEDGTIKVDEEKLAESLKSGDTEEGLGTLRDFTKFALRKAGQVQLNPMDYVDKRIVAYKDPTKPHYANPYVTSAYSGMLFNGYM